MSDEPPQEPVAKVKHAKLDHHRRLSLIWAIPIVTLLIAAWLAWTTLSERGPLITITFESAEGLQAGQSHVRHKDVDMGTVQKVQLTDDLQHVLVTVRMNKEAKPLLNDRTKFWVVKPRFFAGSVSGLQTLISGAYIEMFPSRGGTGKPTRSFVGLENPPVLQTEVPGRTFLLKAPRIGSITLGSPVFFRDLQVGEVLGWDVANMAANVTIHVFVRAPFDKYVHDSSRFWNASGASLKLGATGLEFQVESWRALVLGGIAFETPNEGKNSPIAAGDHTFPLYPTQDAANAATYERHIPMLTNFTGSVGSLAAGAPVSLRGIKIGEVKSVELRYDKSIDNIVVAVKYEVAPNRIAQLPPSHGTDLDSRMRELVQRGLRVKVETANLITGQKQLAIDLFPHAPPAALQKQNDTYVIPALPGSSEDVTAAAGDLLAQLQAIPFDQIGRKLYDTLTGLDGLVNSGALRDSLTSLQQTMTETQSLLHNLNAGAEPLLKRLPSIASSLEETVRRSDQLLGSMQQGYGGSSQFSRDASQLLVQLSEAARSIRVLADLLTRHPEALIRGRPEAGTP